MSETVSASRSVESLFRPFEMGTLRLANRIVMAPMTRSHSPGGVPGSDVARYYRRRSEGGVGLIITEGTTVDHPPASSDPSVPRFHGEAPLQGWARVVREVHEAGGRIMPQLWHVGSTRKPGTGPFPDAVSAAPSGLVGPGKKLLPEMTETDIADVVRSFANGAAAAQALGFDGVELHGAHGYLIDQFFWAGTNERTDRYGGSIEKRTRLAVEIIEAVRERVGPDFPLVLRFSQWKQQDFEAKLAHTPQDLERFLLPLVEAGVDIFHASTRRFWVPEFEGSRLNLAGWTRKITGKPAITVGSVGLDQDFVTSFQGASAGTADIEELVERLEREEFDLVAVGRALLVDGEWAEKVRAGRSEALVPFSPEALKVLA